MEEDFPDNEVIARLVERAKAKKAENEGKIRIENIARLMGAKKKKTKTWKPSKEHSIAAAISDIKNRQKKLPPV